MFVMFILRYFIFHLYESPKYLMGRGRDEEAVVVVHKLAEYNGKTSTLTIEQLRAVEDDVAGGSKSGDAEKGAKMDTSAMAAVRRRLRQFNMDHVKALFATRKLAWSTSLLITLWGEWFPSHRQAITYADISSSTALIGLAFPL